MILIRITIRVLLEKQKEVMQTLSSMIGPANGEKGCLSYCVYRDIETENIFSLLSEWNTREDLDFHIKSNRFSILLGTRSLLHESPSIQIHTVSRSEGIEVVKELRKKHDLDFSMQYGKEPKL